MSVSIDRLSGLQQHTVSQMVIFCHEARRLEHSAAMTLLCLRPAGPNQEYMYLGACRSWQDNTFRSSHSIKWPHTPQTSRGNALLGQQGR